VSGLRARRHTARTKARKDTPADEKTMVADIGSAGGYDETDRHQDTAYDRGTTMSAGSDHMLMQ
jgi:hypothetical protein